MSSSVECYTSVIPGKRMEINEYESLNTCGNHKKMVQINESQNLEMSDNIQCRKLTSKQKDVKLFEF